jgi:glycosyltransferase involved in cell wall biosynthesis
MSEARTAGFTPCIIIPVYNHHQKIGAVVERLAAFGVPCLMVDDGSCDECRDLLKSLAVNHRWITLIRQEPNQGKGAAVCLALREAAKRGFTHALQVDADGQHNLDDLPAFLAMGREHPGSVVSGERIYSTVPGNRRYGRLLTDVWVWINTLSGEIRDSMCGYRLYPLAATLQVLDTYPIGRRMDFDTDILVKLYWEGVGVRHVPTAVVYHDEIISHFDLWRDNVRITRMHTALFFGMLRRIPQLLLRRWRHASH